MQRSTWWAAASERKREPRVLTTSCGKSGSQKHDEPSVYCPNCRGYPCSSRRCGNMCLHGWDGMRRCIRICSWCHIRCGLFGLSQETFVGWIRSVHPQPVEQVPLVNEAKQPEPESVAVMGHVAGFLLPLLGPLALLALSRTRSKLVRTHLIASLVVSTAWLVMATVVISVDVGRFSVDEQATSGLGLFWLLVVGGLIFLIVILNVQRAKRGQSPIAWRPSRQNG